MRKLEVTQKKVLFHSRTKVQLGSGWKPLKMGLLIVDASASAPLARSMVVMRFIFTIDSLLVLTLTVITQ